MRILITAGPTREPLDDVRFLSNAATGRLGIEVARAGAEAGHEVVLVLGPTHLAVPQLHAIRCIRVTTALEMLAACRKEWPRCDALVATAAVADQRPAVRAEGKPDKGSTGATLELVPNPDILLELGASKGARRVVGFALQAGAPDEAERFARAKLVRKNLDAVVLDSPAALGAERADFRLIPASGIGDGAVREFRNCSKRDLALAVVAFLRS